MIEESRNQFPQACPNDGQPVRTGPNGEVYCPWGDWEWDGTPESAYPPVR